jgi:hypothetical protein
MNVNRYAARINNRDPSRAVDLVLFGIANLVNLLVAVILLSRTYGFERFAHGIGIAVIVMAIPITVAVLVNMLERRDWWAIVLPLPLALFCVVELVFDYLLNLQFRTTSLLWPYLIIYYFGLIGLIGYSFGIGKRYGCVTLGTYFLNLLATWLARSLGVP